jgi:diaminopimelate decarboxylase
VSDPPVPTPRLPDRELLDFVLFHAAGRERYLSAAAGKTPVYLLEPEVLAERAARFRGAFAAELSDIGCYFAMKSNNAPEVSREMIRAGFGLDVSSGLELAAALDLRCPDIVFSGPGKTRAELEQAVDNSGSVTLLVDSFGELERLEATAAGKNVRVRAGVRLNPDPRGLWRKFGIPLESLPEFLDRVRACPHVDLRGLQFHSSWNMDPDRQTAFIRTLGHALSAMPGDFAKTLEFLDVGGGYWPPRGEWLVRGGTPEGILERALGKEGDDPLSHHRVPAVPIETFARELGRALREHILPLARCRVCFEPGRWICNDAMHILVSVVDVKEPGMVVCDAGTNAVGWERYESDYCPVLNLTRWAPEEKACRVLGSLCTPHDVWGFSYWGSDIREGDVLMIPCQGAYTYSLRQSFIKPVPPVLVL